VLYRDGELIQTIPDLISFATLSLNRQTFESVLKDIRIALGEMDHPDLKILQSRISLPAGETIYRYDEYRISGHSCRIYQASGLFRPFEIDWDRLRAVEVESANQLQKLELSSETGPSNYLLPGIQMMRQRFELTWTKSGYALTTPYPKTLKTFVRFSDLQEDHLLPCTAYCIRLDNELLFHPTLSDERGVEPWNL